MFRATSATGRTSSMTKATACALYSSVKLRRVEPIPYLPADRAANHGVHQSGNGPFRLAVGLTFGLTVGLTGGLAGGLAFGLTVWLVFGFRAGLVGGPLRPARRLRWHPNKLELMVWPAVWLVGGLVAVLTGRLAFGIVGGIVGGIAVGIAVGLGVGLVGGLPVSPADPTIAADPRSLFVQDRAAFRSTVLAFGLLFGIMGGLLVVPAFGLVAGLAGGLSFTLDQTAWGWVVVARGWLAIRRRLPRRLMAFLADAHEHRGVLRQVGAVYQFRHLELQRRLATRPTAAD
jgi:hypothetical protein